MWILITLYDNDFWLDLEFLGTILTKILNFNSFHKIDCGADVLKDNTYKAYIRDSIVNLLISIYTARNLLEPNIDLSRVNSFRDDYINIKDYFTKHIKVYLSGEELEAEYSSKIRNTTDNRPLQDIKYADELTLCYGNYEHLFIHVSSYECSFIIV